MRQEEKRREVAMEKAVKAYAAVLRLVRLLPKETRGYYAKYARENFVNYRDVDPSDSSTLHPLFLRTYRHSLWVLHKTEEVVVDNGKSDRITIVDNSTLLSSQHAVTQYRVIGSSSQGYTWLELSPLTGRKHQLRVHCAEVLGTPIVGDYKYGWQAHRKWGLSNLEEDSSAELHNEEALPFGLNWNKGSISDKCHRLHLHCKQIVLPNISQALQNTPSASHYDLSQVESLELVAPLPPYMQRSWNTTNS